MHGHARPEQILHLSLCVCVCVCVGGGLAEAREALEKKTGERRPEENCIMLSERGSRAPTARSN